MSERAVFPGCAGREAPARDGATRFPPGWVLEIGGCPGEDGIGFFRVGCPRVPS